MREHIKNLSRSKELTICQIAKQLQVSKNLVMQTLKDENSRLLYNFRLEYLGKGNSKNATPLEGWFREIQIVGKMTLNGLNDCIQHVLGWDNAHCYVFIVRENHYAFLGKDDDFIVEDVFENHYSTKIPIYLLGLCENDCLIYNSDFGDNQFFLLTVSEIERAAENALPRVTGAGGKDLSQYEYPHYEEEVLCAITKSTEFDVDKINSTLSIATSIRRHDIRKVDFIVGKDRDTLEEWRRSKDRSKWEKAVTILENRSMSLELLATKIERPIIKVREWILDFNYYGMEALHQTIAKKNRINVAKLEIMEQQKKRLIEIIHHKPKYYDINRSSWSLASLANVYSKQYSVKISSQAISKSLKEAQYTIKKARRVLTSPDPEYREKVDILLKTLNTLGPDELLFFIDELGPAKVRKYGGRIYSKITDTPTYPQNQIGKGSVSLAGALSATTNQMTWMYIEAKDSAAMISLAEVLFNQYYSKKNFT
jgi:transposase